MKRSEMNSNVDGYLWLFGLKPTTEHNQAQRNEVERGRLLVAISLPSTPISPAPNTHPFLQGSSLPIVCPPMRFSPPSIETDG
jgi:hypothetical protein